VQPWTEAELALLRDVSLSLAEVAERTGRSKAAVEHKASNLGVSRVFRRGGKGKARSWQHGWEPWELELLADPGTPLTEVATATWRSSSAVRHKASRLGLVGIRNYWLRGDEHGNANWSEADLALLFDTSLLLMQVAQLTSHSLGACGCKAHKLGIKRGRRSGAEHPRWVNGQYSDTYRGPDWRAVRAQILERDGYVCQDCRYCDLSGHGLHVHHQIPWRLRQSNDPHWLITLCRSCHSRRPEHAWVEIPESVALFLHAADSREVSSPRAASLLLDGRR
jgi:5-methylcytosine-specific restriction endonuclease McrA